MIPRLGGRARAARETRRDLCYKRAVAREISSGGVVVRRLRGRWWFAAIRPRGRGERTWALPKGIVDPGENPAETAVREAAEETGLVARLDTKLGDVKYVYTRRGTGERVFKVVSFYLLRYRRGRIGELPPGMALEVAEARWLPLEDGPRLLSYGGERDMVRKALEILREQPV
jgi:8-oxo-dGTP pyrophosphatase MutT (NUDIX family)